MKEPNTCESMACENRALCASMCLLPYHSLYYVYILQISPYVREGKFRFVLLPQGSIQTQALKRLFCCSLAIQFLNIQLFLKLV
jgi:hypothetical protein